MNKINVFMAIKNYNLCAMTLNVVFTLFETINLILQAINPVLKYTFLFI